MSYPEPRYLGEPGLANATFRPSDHEPDIRQANGGAVQYLATGDTTSGQFGLYRWEMSGPKTGPGPHFHRTISESFYVLTGTIRLYDGERWLDGKPGDFLFVPEGGIHAFTNESGEPASMLILFAPGAPREEYFETTARLAAGLVLTDEERTEFYLRHDTYWR
jgi:mannose-6-phosphate isomerase-like protein (cupin superfamily)